MSTAPIINEALDDVFDELLLGTGAWVEVIIVDITEIHDTVLSSPLSGSLTPVPYFPYGPMRIR